MPVWRIHEAIIVDLLDIDRQRLWRSLQRIWRKRGLQPPRIRQFKLSDGPRFAAKLLDIVGLDANPPERAVVRSDIDRPHTRDAPCGLAIAMNSYRAGVPDVLKSYQSSSRHAGGEIFSTTSSIS